MSSGSEPVGDGGGGDCIPRIAAINRECVSLQTESLDEVVTGAGPGVPGLDAGVSSGSSKFGLEIVLRTSESLDDVRGLGPWTQSFRGVVCCGVICRGEGDKVRDRALLITAGGWSEKWSSFSGLALVKFGWEGEDVEYGFRMPAGGDIVCFSGLSGSGALFSRVNIVDNVPFRSSIFFIQESSLPSSSSAIGTPGDWR